MPMFFGYSVKHLALAASYGSWLSYFVSSFVLLAAFAGLFYSYRVLFFVFFDSKKGRKSMYLSQTGASFRSLYYSNTTLGSTLSILALALCAYLVSYLAASSLVVDSGLTLSDGASAFGQEMSQPSSLLDRGLHFNFKLLNSCVLIFFFFLNFFSWQRSVHLSYSSACFLALAILLA